MPTVKATIGLKVQLIIKDMGDNLKVHRKIRVSVV